MKLKIFFCAGQPRHLCPLTAPVAALYWPQRKQQETSSRVRTQCPCDRPSDTNTGSFLSSRRWISRLFQKWWGQ